MGRQAPAAAGGPMDDSDGGTQMTMRGVPKSIRAVGTSGRTTAKATGGVAVPLRWLGVALVCALLGSVPEIVSAQHFPSEADLTALIQGRVDEGRATGIVLGVMEADGTTRIVSAGDAGPGARPLSEATVFEIGSITKAFTGTLLADMARRGEVSLNDPVAKYLPDGVRMPTRGGREITLLDVATHHSALPRLPGNMSPADPSNPYGDYTVEMMYSFLSGYELPRDIGSQYEYSNLAVGLLGHLLSLRAGTDYETLVRQRILEPLGMESSGITLSAEMKTWMAKGHDQDGSVVPMWDLSTLAGAGALRSNMVDMLRFLAANTGVPRSDLERAMRLSHEQRMEMSPQAAIGLNWHIMKSGGSSIVWHNGGTAGFRTFIGFDPVLGVGAVVLTNSAHGADDIGLHLINEGIPLAAPEVRVDRTEVAVSVDVLRSYVGEYQLAPEFSIAITLDGEALFLQATGQPKLPIFAESDTEFFLKVVEAQITFERGADGAVSGLILHQGGRDTPGRRVR